MTSHTTAPIPNTNPVTVTLNANPSRYAGAPVNAPAASSGAFTPFSASVTFPAGVTSETVGIPIPAGSADAGPVLLDLSLTSTTLGVSGTPTQSVFLVDSPGALPPTITSVHLVGISGHHAAGIAITFSKPMAAATVENIDNYSVTSLGMSGGVQLPNAIEAPLNWFFGYSGPEPLIKRTSIRSAVYNATTDTVTLIPRHPLVSTAQYSITSPKKLAGHMLTDLAGNPLFDGVPYDGSFSSIVSRNSSESQSPTRTVGYA
jgi:hypothetical protein